MFFAHQYLATVRDESHQVTKRIVSAKNQNRAIFQLQNEKYRVLAIEPRPSPFWQALRNGRLEFTAPADKRDLANFSSNLSLMALVQRNSATL